MKKIGRIVDFQSSWPWFQMDDAGELKAGDVIRVTPYSGGDHMRTGTATIAMRMGHALHFDEPLYLHIPALCDMDYVYLVEDV